MEKTGSILLSIFFISGLLVSTNVLALDVNVSSLTLDEEETLCPLNVSDVSGVTTVYEDFEWFTKDSSEAKDKAQIYNEALATLEGYELNSADDKTMDIAVARIFSPDENIVTWYFSPLVDDEDDVEDVIRFLEVRTPSGDLYKVAEEKTLHVEMSNPTGEIGGLAEQVGLIAEGGSCLALAALYAAPINGYLIGNLIPIAGSVISALALPGGDDAAVIPPGSSDDPGPSNNNDICGIPGCSSCESFNAGVCSVTPDQPNDCGCPPPVASPSS